MRQRLQTALLLSADKCLFAQLVSQECIYNHFLHSKEAKRVLSGKQSKVLPAINGSSPDCGITALSFAKHAETLAPAPLCSAQEAV